MDRILHGSGELLLSSYEEGEIAILRDEIYKMTVRLREQSETLAEDKAALADSLADISHQIRTPLTTLNLMTARMMREGDDPEQRKTDPERNEPYVGADRVADHCPSENVQAGCRRDSPGAGGYFYGEIYEEGTGAL